MNNPVGVMAGMRAEREILGGVERLGLKCCQVCCWDMKLYTREHATRLNKEIRKTGIKVTSLWAGWPGPAVWNFVQGPSTLGLVPRKYRKSRVAALKMAADFAVWCKIPAIVTHLGFIPEAPVDPVFKEMVSTVKEVAVYCKKRGLEFWFETGQETPVTMLRLIQEVNTGNLGVNLDPANLILYGKASPVDSLDVFGKYVAGIHAKDGVYPTDPMSLGHEVRVGTGKVRFPELIRKLGKIGYKGAFIIEREISGEQQIIDIKKTIGYLDRLLRRK